jgi:hypothetical protein
MSAQYPRRFKVTIWFIAFASLSYETLAFADSFYGAAVVFRDAASGVYQQGVDVCGGDCEPEFSGPLSNLGATLDPLNAAISSGNQQRIRDAITGTAATLQPICNALLVDCPITPLGPVEGSQSFEEEGTGDSANWDCESICDWREGDCEGAAGQSEVLCLNAINEYVGCRLETPFCDWRSAPFDSVAYANCRSNAVYRQFLSECRCPVPPGQAERAGGCPDFFTQGVGQIGTGICEIPDGQGCARCCNAKCVPGDSRLSCRGGNRQECDVCEWSRRTLVAGTSMRASICEESNFWRIDRCYTQYDECLSRCH